MSKPEESCWPYTWETDNSGHHDLQTVLQSQMNQYGFAVMKIDEIWMKGNVSVWCEYLGKLLKCPEKCSTITELKSTRQIYRHENQLQSVHIPMATGRTSYGHFLKSNLQIFQQIQKVVGLVLSGNQTKCVVTTCDFILQPA
jgi:hypothetical protein